MQNEAHQQAFQTLNDTINNAVIGQEHVVRTLLLSLLTNGNVPVSYTHLTLPTMQ